MTTTQTDAGRTELAKLLGDHFPQSAARDDYLWSMADVIMERGFRKPRTITTVEELDALPLHSVIVDDAGDGIVYRRMNLRQEGIQWYEPGYLMNWDSDEITLPATVLHEPEAEVGA